VVSHASADIPLAVHIAEVPMAHTREAVKARAGKNVRTNVAILSLVNTTLAALTAEEMMGRMREAARL